MGSPKAQTIGYKYYMGLHMGVCKAADALLEIRAGDRTAWAGELTESGSIEINAPKLFGGDEKEGGLQGTLDVMFGEPTQVANSYLEAKQGTPQPAYRGFFSTVYRQGLVAAMNPYIKNWAYRIRRIVSDWHGGTCWYEAKAPILLEAGGAILANDAAGWEYKVLDYHANPGTTNLTPPTSGWSTGTAPFGSGIGGSNGLWPVDKILWSRISLPVTPGRSYTINMAVENGGVLLVDGEVVGDVNGANVSIDGGGSGSFVVSRPAGSPTTMKIAIKSFDERPAVTGGGAGTLLYVTASGADRYGMNPAHIVYQCLTDPDWGMGYPTSAIDEDSFTAAADTLFDEGFGLCLRWTNQSSVEDFIQIVADHAGFVLGQDRRTGLFRIVMLRDDYDVGTLPRVTPANARIFNVQRPALANAVNEIIVKYRDILTGKEAATPPAQNLANIQGQGRVVSQTLNFPGLVTHPLAARVAMRELLARSSALWRMDVEMDREFYDLLPGEPFVLDWPPLGIEIVLRAGEIDYGTTGAGKITAKCVEDFLALPVATYIGEQESGWEEPGLTPAPAAAESAFEVPYRDLAQTLGAGDLAALPDDAGYVAAVAARPAGASVLNFGLQTRISPAEYEQVAIGDFGPTGALSAEVDYLDTVLTLDDAEDLDLLTVGSGVMLGAGADAEICVVTAVDTGTNQVTVGRGCADTVPKVWPIGTRLWAYDLYSAADQTQYVEGEEVHLKVLPRAGGGELDVEDAAELSVTLAQRAFRPYPPGALEVNGSAFAPVPAEFYGETITLDWAHRDRVLQDDGLIDHTAATIGPEAGTEYRVRLYDGGTLVRTWTSSGTPATWSYAAAYQITDGPIQSLTITLHSLRDSVESWQGHEFTLERYGLGFRLGETLGGVAA